MIEDIDDVYSNNDISDELKIQTYYESLDIAQSNRVHYLSFTIPEIIPGPEKDHELKASLKEKHEEII
jgi:tRNA (guanine-N7-)-methyltransferase